MPSFPIHRICVCAGQCWAVHNSLPCHPCILHRSRTRFFFCGLFNRRETLRSQLNGRETCIVSHFLDLFDTTSGPTGRFTQKHRSWSNFPAVMIFPISCCIHSKIHSIINISFSHSNYLTQKAVYSCKKTMWRSWTVLLQTFINVYRCILCYSTICARQWKADGKTISWCPFRLPGNWRHGKYCPMCKRLHNVEGKWNAECISVVWGVSQVNKKTHFALKWKVLLFCFFC